MIASLLRWLFAGRVANTEILKCEDDHGTNPKSHPESPTALENRREKTEIPGGDRLQGPAHRQLCVKRLSVTEPELYSQLYSQLKS